MLYIVRTFVLLMAALCALSGALAIISSIIQRDIGGAVFGFFFLALGSACVYGTLTGKYEES